MLRKTRSRPLNIVGFLLVSLHNYKPEVALTSFVPRATLPGLLLGFLYRNGAPEMKKNGSLLLQELLQNGKGYCLSQPKAENMGLESKSVLPKARKHLNMLKRFHPSS